ncbi:MAG: D-aminoacyl-tRNA deacylase [Gaiellaceae bacterium]
MRVVAQRVVQASVSVAGIVHGSCERGLVILVGIAAGDSEEDAVRLAGRVARLRVFENDEGRLDRSIAEIGGGALVVSQFTLVADTRKGNRPSFAAAAPPDLAEPLYKRFCDALRAEGVEVATGVFGARMELTLVNDGPVTIVLET